MRIALIVLGVILLALVGGFIYAGLVPTHPAVHSVDRTLPNDHFPTQ